MTVGPDEVGRNRSASKAEEIACGVGAALVRRRSHRHFRKFPRRPPKFAIWRFVWRKSAPV